MKVKWLKMVYKIEKCCFNCFLLIKACVISNFESFKSIDNLLTNMLQPIFVVLEGNNLVVGFLTDSRLVDEWDSMSVNRSRGY